jgi:large subunit ribosomal protein L15
MRIHNLSSTHPRPKARRVGRGNAGHGGTTAGRGTKGQKARTGANSNIPRTFIGGSTSLVQRLPKLKGFKSHQIKPVAISMRRLETVYSDGETVTLVSLLEKGLISSQEALQGIKIIGGVGAPAKKLTFEEGNTKLSVSKKLLAS